MFKIKGQGHSVTVKHNVSAVKRYKTSADRLSDFKLGMGVVMKADNDYRGVPRPQVASQLPHFLVEHILL